MQKKIRQLAAIMFTDMVGYTALMQSDEQQAKSNRDRHRSVLGNCIQEHHGIILQYYGDGTLSVFGSAVEAAQAAVQIQQELQKDPVIPLRVGIHVGDVVYDDDGIYGDGVNVASRIESMAVPGSVLVSGKLYDEIKNQPDLPAVSLGNFRFKNVDRPLNVFAIKAESLTVPKASQLKNIETHTATKSIAVLPFVNMSTDPENEFFSDGISEEIINALTRVEGLQVTSRTSSFAFKGRNEDVREIGATLNVDNVLEGSVRKAGNRVRITAQLIKTADGYHIWSEVYDRELEDIFAVQDEISRKIANTLRQSLSENEAHKSLVESKTNSLEAYNLYLKGIQLFSRWSPENVKLALSRFQDAIKIDPDFSLAYSGLAWTMSYLGASGQFNPDDAFPQAEKYARRALDLDPESGDAWSSIALVHFFYTYDWPAAKEAFDKAVSLNPGSAKIRHIYSWFLYTNGKLKEAFQEIKYAATLDPLDLPTQSTLANIYAMQRKYGAAIRQINHVLKIDPDFRAGLETKAWIYTSKGDLEKALRNFKLYQKKINNPLHGLSGMGYIYGLMGKVEKAREIIDKMYQRQKQETNILIDMDLALVYLGLQEYDKMYAHMQKAFDKRNGIIFTLSNDLWGKIHDQKRYKEMIDKIGIKWL